MNDMSKITLTMCPIANIRLAPENPRHTDPTDDGIKSLAANILEHGVLTPLIGYEETGVFYVTAGGRRTRALELLRAEGHLSDTDQVPVKILMKESATNAGIAEQLTHEKLTEVDELRVFALEVYADATDAQLARVVGRTAKYVEQRRKILHLPDHIVAATLAGEINVNQAAGLTYFAEKPDVLDDWFDRAKRDKRLTGDYMRSAYERDHNIWQNSRWSTLVNQDDYKAAGGALVADLFSDDEFIMNPDILEKLGWEATIEAMKAEHPNAAFFVEVTNTWDAKRHPGLPPVLPDDYYDQLDKANMAYDDAEENGDIAEIEAAEKRLQELEDMNVRGYPPELEAMLGVAWARSSYGDPIRVVPHALPADLEPLYEAGFLERPTATADSTETAEAKVEDSLSATLVQKIKTIRTHALRMELAKKPDEVLKRYLVHVQSRMGYMAHFLHVPEAAHHLPEGFPARTSTAWDTMLHLNEAGAEAVPSMKPADMRKLMAFKMLMCMTVHAPTDEIDAATVRSYWTPDDDFLNSYKRPALEQMLEEIDRDGKSLLVALMSELKKEPKKKDLVTALADHAKSTKDWLPLGF